MLLIDRQGDYSAALMNALGGTDYVARLTGELSAVTGKNAVPTCTLDGAVHTALYLCGVRSGDYVFVPTFTFYSYLAPVTNMGAVPVFLDCDPGARCVSPLALETAFVWAELQNKLPKAVIVDNAFGSVADFDRLMPMCKAWNVPVIELCADAYCGTYKGKPCGAHGDYGVFGFGGGAGCGAVVCGDDIGQARQFTRYEYTDGENHDYRLNNYSAAIACAYLRVAPKIHDRAAANLAALLSSLDCVTPPVPGDAATYALCKTDRFRQIAAAGFNVIKPFLTHTLDKYAGSQFFEHEQGFSVSEGFLGHCFIDLDFSAFKRFKLISLLKSEMNS